MEFINEEMHLEKEWFKKAEQTKTMKDLTTFITHILEDYHHDYGTSCHAVAACALAAAWLACTKEGLSGFQAGFVMWDFILNFTKKGNKCGLKLIDYDDFLYPQYGNKFDKTVSNDTWQHIQEEAKKNLETETYACGAVCKHWEDIVNGIIPFGYRIENEW